VSLIVPIGAGFKYYVNDNFYVGFEITHRKSFTDYMDDVSTTYIDNNLFAKYLSPEQTAMANQLYYRGNLVPNGVNTRNPPVGDIRGNPKQNDSYFSSIIRMGFRLDNWNSPLSVKQMRCPSFY
ncbi:MAG TPA: hypothetical protein VHK91_14110, partial [Flavisolibacter sp.]|nr:hypothetical protein [Flavisolibacter sp.]